MKCFFTLSLLAFLLVVFLGADAQAFVNGSLNGTIGVSNTPTSWSQVPFGDAISQATMTLSATSDVTGTTGPFSGNINGNPYHGTTYVSGLHMQNGSDIWHEGIMQTVSGLAIGTAYNIRFYQNVTKQSNATDNSGSWSVYRENTLIATSAPCTDNSAVGSNAHPWFLRTVTFTATATSHTIKFIPTDDDPNIVSPAGVRMGIDSITLSVATPFAASMDFRLSLRGTREVVVEWEDDPAPGLSQYEVQHSPDGLHFESIGHVEAGNGTKFQWVDRMPFIESHYRIASVQADGGMNFTEVKHISTQAPVEAKLFGRRLEVSGGYGGIYAITLMDMQGREVFFQQVPEQADLTLLAPGIYCLRVVSEREERAILEKKILLQ